MKTIRHNTFETNSSSTHSITIINKNDINQSSSGYAKLVIDGVLQPGNLKYTAAYVKIENTYDEDSWILTASTRDQKAALFCHHVKSYLYDGWDRTYTDEDALAVLQAVRIMMCNSAFGYTDVNMDFIVDFNHYSEHSDSYIETCMDHDDMTIVLQSLENNINDVIDNDDMIIRTSEEPY